MPNYDNELNKILLKSNTITVPAGKENNSDLAGAVVKNLTDFGYVVDERGLNMLATSSREEIAKWYFDTMSILQDESTVSIKPTYIIPDETMKKSDWEIMMEWLKDVWENDKQENSREMNVNGSNDSGNSSDGDGNGNVNSDDTTNAGRDTINLGYEVQNENINQKVFGLRLDIRPRVIRTIDGRDRKLVVNETAKAFSNVLKEKMPTVKQTKEIVNPFIDNVQDWNTYVTQCASRDMLTYLYARALIDGKKTETMPELKAKEYLTVAQKISWMKENPVYEESKEEDKEEKQLDSKSETRTDYIIRDENANVEVDASIKPETNASIEIKEPVVQPQMVRQEVKQPTTGSVEPQKAVNVQNNQRVPETKAVETKAQNIKLPDINTTRVREPKYRMDDVKVRDELVKITSCGAVSGRKLRQFIATGLEKTQDLETEISGRKSEKMWKAIFDKQLHIKQDFPTLENVNRVNQKLQSNIPLINLDREIEKAKKEERYEDILKLLKNRPNLFIKRINEMLNLPIQDSEKKVNFAVSLLNTAKETLPKADPESLVTFISYLKSRTRSDRVKVHNVGGKLYVDNKNYAQLPPKTAEVFTQIAKGALADKLVQGKPIGAVYIEQDMEKMALPNNNDINQQMPPRGSKIHLPEEKQGKIRFMIWTDKNTTHTANTRNKVADISASFFKNNDGELQHQADDDLTWDSDKKSNSESYKDSITNGNDSVEYIDLDLKNLEDADIAYVMLYVNVWPDDSTFSDEKINFGWTDANEPEALEIGQIQENQENIAMVNQPQEQQIGNNNNNDNDTTTTEKVIEEAQPQVQAQVQAQPVVMQNTERSIKNGDGKKKKETTYVEQQNTGKQEVENSVEIGSQGREKIVDANSNDKGNSGKLQNDDETHKEEFEGKVQQTNAQPQSNDALLQQPEAQQVNRTSENTALNSKPTQQTAQPTNSIPETKETKKIQTVQEVQGTQIPQSHQRIQKSQITQTPQEHQTTSQLEQPVENILDKQYIQVSGKVESVKENVRRKEEEKPRTEGINVDVKQNTYVSKPITYTFKPKVSYQLTGNTRGIVPVMIDVKNREAICVNMFDKNSDKNIGIKGFVRYADAIVDMYGKNDRMTMAEVAKLVATVNNSRITNNPREADVLFTVKEHPSSELKSDAVNVTAINPKLWFNHIVSVSSEVIEAMQKEMKTKADRTLLDTFEALIVRDTQEKRENEEKEQSAQQVAHYDIAVDQQIMEQRMNPEQAREKAMKELEEKQEQISEMLEDEQKLSDILDNFSLNMDKDDAVVDTGEEEEEFDLY